MTQALSAQHLFLRDRHYVVAEGKVQIVDASTGRLMPDRSWERGLHQLVEVKEGCEVSGDKETLARLSYQRFFTRYLKLGGMSGTVRGIEAELSVTYGLATVTIPTHRPSRRRTLPARTFTSAAARDRALVAGVSEQFRAGRPVLLGTRTVEECERLGQMLIDAGLEVRILNARHAAEEAAIVAEAGGARAHHRGHQHGRARHRHQPRRGGGAKPADCT